jgi:hypothetical protein
MDWLVRLDMIALALMLAYPLLFVSRTSYFFHSARCQYRDFEIDAINALRSGAH